MSIYWRTEEIFRVCKDYGVLDRFVVWDKKTLHTNPKKKFDYHAFRLWVRDNEIPHPSGQIPVNDLRFGYRPPKQAAPAAPAPVIASNAAQGLLDAALAEVETEKKAVAEQQKESDIAETNRLLKQLIAMSVQGKQAEVAPLDPHIATEEETALPPVSVEDYQETAPAPASAPANKTE